MGIFDWLFKSKSPAQKNAETLEKLRKKSIIKERRSSMHEILVGMPGIENQDIHPKGSGQFGLELTNPIPVYGIDNIPVG